MKIVLTSTISRNLSRFLPKFVTPKTTIAFPITNSTLKVNKNHSYHPLGNPSKLIQTSPPETPLESAKTLVPSIKNFSKKCKISKLRKKFGRSEKETIPTLDTIKMWIKLQYLSMKNCENIMILLIIST